MDKPIHTHPNYTANMYLFPRLLLIFLGFIYSSHTIGQVKMTDSPFKIYDSAKQRLISLEELASSVDDVDVLFFGEEHDDSLGHVIQDRLYTLLLDKYTAVALSMEMFETDCQLVLDEYLGGFIDEKKMVKDARAWKNYEEHYKPMVEKAKEKQQAVIAANAPRRYVSMVSSKGLEELDRLPKASKNFLPPLPIFTENSAYLERFLEAMGSAGHDKANSFFYAQCTWDASMAYRIYMHWKKNKNGKILHLNGRFHTDYQQGTVDQLRRLNKKITMKNISCTRVENFESPDWSSLVDQGDFIIISQKKG